MFWRLLRVTLFVGYFLAVMFGSDPALAATSTGIDTPIGVTTLPLAVGGVEVMNLSAATVTFYNAQVNVDNGGLNVAEKVGIGTTAQAALDVFMPETGVTQPNAGALLFRVQDGNSLPALAAYGKLDNAAFPDEVASTLQVREVNGTARSITTTGSIAVGGGNGTVPSYFLGGLKVTGNVGFGTTPAAALDVMMPNTGAGQTDAGALLFRVRDGLGYPALAAYGKLDTVAFPDEVASALQVREVNGTARSITTTGSIAVGGGGGTVGSYILGALGIGTTRPTQALEVDGYIKANGIIFPDGTVQTTAAPKFGGMYGTACGSGTPQPINNPYTGAQSCPAWAPYAYRTVPNVYWIGGSSYDVCPAVFCTSVYAP